MIWIFKLIEIKLYIAFKKFLKFPYLVFTSNVIASFFFFLFWIILAKGFLRFDLVKTECKSLVFVFLFHIIHFIFIKSTLLNCLVCLLLV